VSKTVVFDIETDGFLDVLTLMSVAWTYCIEEGEWIEWREWEVDKLVEYLNTSTRLVAHNGIAFDSPAVEKITSTPITSPIFDTMVASRALNPDRYGGHSLKAWGIRLGILKGSVGEDGDEDIEEVYGVYTPELSEYCKQDVVVTVALFNRLTESMSPEAIDLDPINWEEYKCKT